MTMNTRPHFFHLLVAILVAAPTIESRSTSTFHRRAALSNDPSKMSGQYCTLLYFLFPPMCAAL